MRPAPRITFPRGLFIAVTIVLTLFTVLPQFLRPTHDDAFTRSLQTHLFTYRVSTYTNTHGKRCALLRCGSEYADRLYHDSTCDIIFADIAQAHTNESFRLCPVDFIHTQWKAISRTYNDGIFFITNDVKLRLEPTQLPLDPQAVHFAAAKNTRDISITWIAIKPSSISRGLFEQWYNSIANKNITNNPAQKLPPDLATLNHVRNCHSSDVVCHSRATSIAWQCDAVRNEMACMMPSYPVRIFQLLFVSLAIVIIISTIVLMVSKVIPRAQGFLGTPLNAHLVSLKFTHVLIAILLIGLAGEDWVSIVKSLSRVLGVACNHELNHEVFAQPGDVFRAVSELRGLHSGYSYVFSDNEQTIRLTGPAVPLVVAATSVMLFVKRIVFNGLLVNAVAVILLFRVGCDVILRVTGFDKSEATIEDDEYIQHKFDIPIDTKPKARSDRRSFFVAKDR